MSFEKNSDDNQEKGFWTCSIQGELDIANANEVREYLKELYDKNPGDIVLEIEGLNYLDSTGLGIFISTYDRLKKENHKITIVNAQPNIDRLLKITHLNEVFY